jgi:hypothetical protein
LALPNQCRLQALLLLFLLNPIQKELIMMMSSFFAAAILPLTNSQKYTAFATIYIVCIFIGRRMVFSQTDVSQNVFEKLFIFEHLKKIK